MWKLSRVVQVGLPLDVTSGTDFTLEHQVELNGGGKLVTGFWVDNVVLFDNVSQFCAGIVINLPTRCQRDEIP
jgi:hypothetical protein